MSGALRRKGDREPRWRLTGEDASDSRADDSHSCSSVVTKGCLKAVQRVRSRDSEDLRRENAKLTVRVEGL